MLQQTKNLTTAEIYQFLVGGVTPRPIAWISTQSATGVNNIAPYSFFSVASVIPPILSITHIAPEAGQAKDTLTNLKNTKQAVINIVNAELAEQMNGTAKAYKNSISEFEELAIATEPSVLVKPLAVKKAQMRFECKLNQVIDLSDQKAGGQLILLDVMGFYIDDNLVDNKHINFEAIENIGKMSADQYCHTSNRFKLQRPS